MKRKEKELVTKMKQRKLSQLKNKSKGERVDDEDDVKLEDKDRWIGSCIEDMLTLLSTCNTQVEKIKIKLKVHNKSNDTKDQCVRRLLKVNKVMQDNFRVIENKILENSGGIEDISPSKSNPDSPVKGDDFNTEKSDHLLKVKKNLIESIDNGSEKKTTNETDKVVDESETMEIDDIDNLSSKAGSPTHDFEDFASPNKESKSRKILEKDLNESHDFEDFASPNKESKSRKILEKDLNDSHDFEDLASPNKESESRKILDKDLNKSEIKRKSKLSLRKNKSDNKRCVTPETDDDDDKASSKNGGNNSPSKEDKDLVEESEDQDVIEGSQDLLANTEIRLNCSSNNENIEDNEELDKCSDESSTTTFKKDQSSRKKKNSSDNFEEANFVSRSDKEVSDEDDTELNVSDDEKPKSSEHTSKITKSPKKKPITVRKRSSRLSKKNLSSISDEESQSKKKLKMDNIKAKSLLLASNSDTDDSDASLGQLVVKASRKKRRKSAAPKSVKENREKYQLKKKCIVKVKRLESSVVAILDKDGELDIKDFPMLDESRKKSKNNENETDSEKEFNNLIKLV